MLKSIMMAAKIRKVLQFTCIITCCTGLLLFYYYRISYSREKPFLAEKCYIDNNYVLLYKIINWWNDCHAKDDNALCGEKLRYTIQGVSRIHYDEKKEILTIETESKLHSLISIFKECIDCRGPAYFKPTYINETYFGNISVDDAHPFATSIRTIPITGVDSEKAHYLMSIAENISIELEGIIGGLLLRGGRIALHTGGDFLKKCPQIVDGQSPHPLTTLIVNNRVNGENILRYEIVMQ